MDTTRRWLRLVLLATLAACTSRPRSDAAATTVRWVTPAQSGPHGQAPNAKARLLSAQPDGLKYYVLVLRSGDEIATALTNLARDKQIVSAHFVAIGAVSDAEVGWFDEARKQFKAITRHEQMEVLTLSGDVSVGTDGNPVVHAHMVVGDSNGNAWGGHILSAIASPTLEVFVTCFPQPLHKQLDPETGLQLIDPSIGTEP
jgi:predicted DNA-binding protein with PD1-like motif